MLLLRKVNHADCSHPRYNRCPNDIDYQIEADYSGIIAPGCPQEAIRLGNVFGLFAVCEKLARQVVVRNGGRVEKGTDGAERFVIPVKTPV